MELRELLQRIIRLPPPAWRSFGLVALLIGGSLSCVNSVAHAATKTNTFALAQQASPDSTVSDDGADVEPEAGSDQVRRSKQRLLSVALVGGVLLLLLAFGYGYLRLELTTRGFYSGRLQIATGIASISTVTTAYFLWRWLIV